MKASYFMIFDYLAIMGVPVLLVLLALNAATIHSGTFAIVLRVLIAAGCFVYGAIGLRAVFFHGRRRRETAGQ